MFILVNFNVTSIYYIFTEQEAQRAMIVAPQPEPPIENATCRRQLLKHLQRCQALIDARLDSIEAQVAGKLFKYF